MLAFTPFSRFELGSVERMLAESYAALLVVLPAEKVQELLGSWREYDAAVFEEPDTVGAAGFCTCVGQAVIGFASWNPMGWPDVGVIGHNCILPPYNGNGFGQRQINEVLRRFAVAGFRKASVSTDEHPFFAPAQRMYSRCGFVEVARYRGELLTDYAMIEYERTLEDLRP